MKNHLLRATLAAILVLWTFPHAYAGSVRALDPPLDVARGELRVSEVGPVAGGIEELEVEDTIAGLETKIAFSADPGTYDVTVISPHGLSERHVVEVSPKRQGTLSLGPTQAGEYSVQVEGREETFTVFSTSVSSERSEVHLPRTLLALGESVSGELRLQDRYGNPIAGWPAVIVSGGEGTVSAASERTDDAGLLAFTFSSATAGENDLFALNPITGEQVGPKVHVSVSDAGFTDSFEVFADPVSEVRQAFPRRIVSAGAGEGVGTKAVKLLASLLKRIAELEEEDTSQSGESFLGLVHHFEFDKSEMPKVVEREQPFDIHLIAKRQDGGVDTGFVGEVEVMSEADDGGQFKKLVTFLASDRGRKKLVLGGTLSQVGKQKIVARLLDDPEVKGEYEILVVARPAELPLLQNLTIREPKTGTEVSLLQTLLRGDAPPFIDLQVRVNGEAVNKFSSLGEEEAATAGYGYEIEVSLPKGTAEFEIFVEQVGGLELTSNVVQLELDTTKPDILTISIEPLEVVAGGETFVRLKTELDALVEVALEGKVTALQSTGEAGEVVTYEGTIIVPETPGEYPLTFFATDRAENRAIAEEILTVTPPPPGAPGLLWAEIEGLDAVLTWEPVSDAKGYRLYFGADAQSLDRSLSLAAPTPKARVRNLERGRSYTFVVTAIDAGDRESDRSNLVTVSIPTELNHLTVAPVFHGVEFGWAEDVPGEPVSILIEYGLADGAFTESRIVPYSLMGTTVGDLIEGIGYHFSISFLNAVGTPVMSPYAFQASPASSGLTGFHPVAAEEISLPLPFLSPSSGNQEFLPPVATVPGYPGISIPPGTAPSQNFSRPPGNAATGSFGIISLVVLLAAASSVAFAIHVRLLHSRERQFLLMMAESYGSSVTVPHG